MTDKEILLMTYGALAATKPEGGLKQVLMLVEAHLFPPTPMPAAEPAQPTTLTATGADDDDDPDDYDDEDDDSGSDEY